MVRIPSGTATVKRGSVADHRQQAATQLASVLNVQAEDLLNYRPDDHLFDS